MFEHILVPLDGSSLAEGVLPHGVAMARTFDARITLLQAVESRRDNRRTGATDPLGWQMRKTEAATYLDEVVDRLSEADVKADWTVMEGDAASCVLEFAHRHNVGLIAISSHGGSGLSEWNISSVVQKVILRAYMPVMIVRAYQPTPKDLTELTYRRLLVPLDGSRRAECVLPLATTLARFHRCPLLLAHVVSRPEVPRRTPFTEEENELIEQLTERNRERGAQYLQGLQSQLSSQVETHLLVSDNAIATLHDLVAEEDVDLVLLSAHGYSGEAKWPYGSVSLNFIAYGTTPLLIVQDIPEEQIETSYAEKAAKERKGH